MKPVSYISPVITSLLLAIIFQLIPVSGDWILWKPNFLMLVVLAWILYLPSRFGVGFAAAVGLLADTLFRTNLGHYMLVFALCGGIAYILSRWLAYFSPLHRAFMVVGLVVLAELLEAALYTIWDVSMNLGHLPALGLTSAIVWLFVDKLVARICQRQR